MVKLNNSCAVFLILILIVLAVGGQAWAQEPDGEFLKYKAPDPPSTSVLSTLAYVFSLIVVFLVVIALAYFTSWFLGQKFGGYAVAGDHKILATLPLGPGKAVYVVDIAGKVLVLGVTDHSINLLQEITSAEDIEKLRSRPGVAGSDGFNLVLRRQMAALQQMSGKFPVVFGSDRLSQSDEKTKK
ncbi:flagellar biosynthetic protein FliO [Sporolituus thermophilus]|nr:flagellar biosynthetic protein FliO [Sporolituus thermophilus]